MQQQISVVTLGITDLPRSHRFYVEGFGWTPVFENEEILFYQMSGLLLGTLSNPSLEAEDVAQACRGSIDLTSTGEATTFTLTMPAVHE